MADGIWRGFLAVFLAVPAVATVWGFVLWAGLLAWGHSSCTTMTDPGRAARGRILILLSAFVVVVTWAAATRWTLQRRGNWRIVAVWALLVGLGVLVAAACHMSDSAFVSQAC